MENSGSQFSLLPSVQSSRLCFFQQELTKETEVGALGFASISGSKCNPDLVHHETHQIHESPARLDHVPSSVSWLIPTCEFARPRDLCCLLFKFHAEICVHRCVSSGRLVREARTRLPGPRTLKTQKTNVRTRLSFSVDSLEPIFETSSRQFE